MPLKSAISRLTALLIGVSGTLMPSVLGQWTAVPSVNFSTIQLSQFADHELEVPYFLNHFAQVANAVVETGTNRGFLDIKVNREPADNQPYNARIMENQLSLAYFYTANRPWNPYRGSTAVKVRLEAMLDRWTRIQNQPGSGDGNFDGLFTEYSASNWSLAPTGFGVRAAAEAIDLIVDSGLPFDAVILEASRVSLRRALIALFTRTDMRNAAKQYSNQFNGAYHAALIYLENWPDAVLDAAFVAAVADSSAQDRSPAGYWYELSGPDFGYSGVHDENLRIALPRLRNRSDLFPTTTADDADWNHWLAANHVPQPGLTTRTFLTNAGVNTRTSDSLHTPQPRPISEFVDESRIFAYTDAEYAAYLVSRRAQVQSQFGNWGPLAVPNAFSYMPGFVHDAVTHLNGWNPTSGQRASAHAKLACLSATSFNRLLRDPRPVNYLYAKRPQYYAAVTSGNIVSNTQQVYGLGLLWNPVFGVALQAVANDGFNDNLLFGTKRSGMTGTYEISNIPAAITAGGAAVSLVNGESTLANGDLVATYTLAQSGTTYGQKSITLGSERVDVSVTHSGAFTERLPLAHASDAVLTTTATRMTLTRPNGSSCVLEVTSPGATFSAGSASSLTSGVSRRPVTISASGSLVYNITLKDADSSPPTVISPVSVSTIPNTAIDVDLRNPANDVQTPDAQLVFKVSQATGGTAQLLADGFTARFTPNTGFQGNASFDFTARDQARDPRLIRHFRFESPDGLSDGLASDSSLVTTDADVAVTGSGAAAFVTDAAAGFPSGESKSLRLTEVDSSNYARLRTNLPITSYNLSNKSWTASFWFKRAASTTNDMLFYIGNGNGFSGSGHELEVFCPANSNTLRLQYWNAANVNQANLSSPATVLVNQWNHAAVVWTATGGGAGTITLNLNGVSVGSASFTAAFKQDVPLVFGGIQDVAADPRNFNGWMDDLALYSDALAGAEITGLATRPVANQAGQETGGIVNVGVIPLEADLAAGWKFDGNFQDSSGNMVQLTPAGGAATSTLRFKQGTHSLALLASGDHAVTTSPVGLGNEFTISSWIYLPSGANSIRTIAANSGSGFNANGFRFFVNRFNAMDGELVLETGNGTQSTLIVSPAGTVLMNRWQFVSAVVNRATQTATLYRNGQIVASGAVRGDFQNTATFDIGAMLGGLNTLRGNVDDFRLYSRLLTASDLLSVMEPSNTAPTVVPPAPFTMAAGSVSGALAIAVDDEESGPTPLILTAVSSNPALLPDTGIVLGGSGSNRTVTVSPVAWLAGSATVTLSVSDGLAVTTAGFVVTVTNGGSSAVWTAIGTDAPLTWSSPENWVLSRTPYPGAACALDFLTGIATPVGTIVAQQDMATPFVANSLTLGGTGSTTFQLQGSTLSLVTNGAGTPAVVLDAAGPMLHAVEVPIQLAASANVSGNGGAGFEFRAPISGNSGITKAGTSVMTLAAANTFTGGVSIQAGALRAAHANSLGSLGSGTTVQGGTALAALELSGDITLGEPVQLVMQNTVGHTQLRNVSGNNILTSQLSLNAGGARWDVASLAGSLTLSGPVVNIAGGTDTWRTLHLTGPASGSITGAMTNSASGNSKLNLSVLSGSWTLAGAAKAYTGTTVVSGGTLQLNTSLMSAVTVQNGGTLTGSGSTGENLTIQTGATVATRLVDWNSLPAALSCAQLVATGASTWTVRLDAAGLTGFSEAARTVPLVAAAAGLVNVNPATIVIQTAGFPGTGVWSVTAAGNSLALVYAPDLYAAWSAGIAWNGMDPAQTADPDLDGLSNLLEYALAGDPLRSGDGAAPMVSQVSGILRLTFQRVADPTLLYEVIGANDLTLPVSAWSQVWSSTGAANISGPVTVNDAVIVPLPSARFLRLRVVR